MKAVKTLLLVVAALMAAKLSSAQTWTQTSAPSTNWQCIASSADGTKLVALTSSLIYFSTNSGATWQPATNVSGLSHAEWASVAGSADGNTWVAAAYGVPVTSSAGGIYVSTNSGLGWVHTSTMWGPLGVACSADGTKMVATTSEMGDSLSTNSGTSWTSKGGLCWYSVTSSADGTKLTAAGWRTCQVCVSADSGAT